MALTPPDHHPKLYHPDGNVVFLAVSSKTGDRVYFRVHKSVIGKQSPVLADMFAMPPLMDDCTQAEADAETQGSRSPCTDVAERECKKLKEVYDGVVLVETPDSAEDVESFLEVLYDPLGSAYKRFNPNTPVLVSGALKLAMKYECDALRSRIVENLEADWPTTLAQWDARRSEAVIARSEHSQQATGKINGLYLDDRLPEPASAIRIASDYAIPSILPAAFYQLALLSTDADWDRYRTNLSGEGRHLRFGARTARWGLLDKTDLMRLVHGQKLVAAYTRAIGVDLFGLRCLRNSKGCVRCKVECWKYFQENAPISMDDPLDVLADCMRLDSLFTELPCATCVAEIKVMAEKKRSELWRSLPAFFNLHLHY
ncbi:hypothetical protein EUX98_g8048 [Antrodiella citrinella]|uniref:BTB domain-containing protein n=1 Tax=Antrodiella citrinella TaxID=2447956 RepID=A0A4V3XGX6_9APHY|nr:hypothetical protein EUX98_g8048 [Antrodiella citrinella]